MDMINEIHDNKESKPKNLAVGPRDSTIKCFQHEELPLIVLNEDIINEVEEEEEDESDREDVQGLGIV